MSIKTRILASNWCFKGENSTKQGEIDQETAQETVFTSSKSPKAQETRKNMIVLDDLCLFLHGICCLFMPKSDVYDLV